MAKDLGFDGIEWAGAPHCPAGDQGAAMAVLMTTLRAGLTISSYAPLYRILPGGGSGVSFSSILATASSLNAPIIRVYAGTTTRIAGTARAALLGELRRLGDEAGAKGIAIALSPGSRTCMESWTDALSLADEVSHPFVGLAWEPLAEARQGEGREALSDNPASFLVLRLRRIDRMGRSRPLAEEAARWTGVVEAFEAKPGEASIGRFALLGGIGDTSDDGLASLAADLAFVRSALPRTGRTG